VEELFPSKSKNDDEEVHTQASQAKTKSDSESLHSAKLHKEFTEEDTTDTDSSSDSDSGIFDNTDVAASSESSTSSGFAETVKPEPEHKNINKAVQLSPQRIRL
jgi:hypothetical protein